MYERIARIRTAWRDRVNPAAWWADLVLAEFAFLAEYGCTLTGSPTAGVYFHFRGNWIAYHCPRRDVSIEYDPESGLIDARVVDLEVPLFMPLDDLIRERHPGAQPPRRVPLDRAAIEENVRWWAAELRSIAPDVLER